MIGTKEFQSVSRHIRDQLATVSEFETEREGQFDLLSHTQGVDPDALTKFAMGQAKRLIRVVAEFYGGEFDTSKHPEELAEMLVAVVSSAWIDGFYYGRALTELPKGFEGSE